MYWIPKLHKTPIVARFIIASRKCSTKPLSKAVSKVFKLIQFTSFLRYEPSLGRFFVLNCEPNSEVRASEPASELSSASKLS